MTFGLIAFGIVGLVGIARLVVLARESRVSVLVRWANARGITEVGDHCTTHVDGIAVRVQSGADVCASAPYVLGAGPTFELALSRLLPQARDRYRADPLVQLVHRTYARRGLASEATPIVVKAILAHVTKPVVPPAFSAANGIVSVRGGDSIDLLVALAAAIAGDERSKLAPLAKALGGKVELDAHGLAYIDITSPVALRLRVRASETDAHVLTTTLSGSIEADAPELTHEAFEAPGDARGRLASPRPDANDAIERLVHRGARLTIRPRDIEARFEGVPAAADLPRIVDALGTVLAHGGESPFR